MMPSVTLRRRSTSLTSAPVPVGDDQDVGALAVAADRVGEALLAPLLDLLDRAALLLDEALDLHGEGVHLRLPEVGVGDEQDLVDTIAQLILLLDRPRHPVGAAGEPLSGPRGPTGSKGSATGRPPPRRGETAVYLRRAGR